MAKHSQKGRHPAHIKENTKGTSNEISFSVLDAMRLTLEDERANKDPFGGGFSFFSLFGRGRKTMQTPERERGIHDASGKFVSTANLETKKSTPMIKQPKQGISLPAFGSFGAGKASQQQKKAKKVSIGAALPKAPSASAPSSREGGIPLALPSAGKSSSKAVPAFTTATPRSSEEELARRKTMRRFRRTSAAVVAVIVVLSLLAVGGTYLAKEIQKKNASLDRLSLALNEVNEVDETILLLDEIVNDPLNPSLGDKRKQVEEAHKAASSSLEEAKGVAEEISLELGESDEKELANQTVVAVTARQDLFEEGLLIVDASNDALSAVESGQEGMSLLAEGNSLMSEAALLVTEDEAERYERSNEKCAKARESFQSAYDCFTAMQLSCEGVDVEVLLSYCSCAMDCLDHAMASNTALIDRDKETASSENDAYNAGAEELGALMEELPDSLEGLVEQAFEENMKETLERYQSARSQAGAADAFIRDYLGVEDK